MVPGNCHLQHQAKGMGDLRKLTLLLQVCSASQEQHAALCQSTHFSSVFCSAKFLFKCRDVTGTSKNCFLLSVYPIIVSIASKEKLISSEK
jgi:hypothetical protein